MQRIIGKPSEIKKLRIEQNITQVELAELAGVSQTNISKIENGEIFPRYDLAERIFKALGYDSFKILLEND